MPTLNPYSTALKHALGDGTDPTVQFLGLVRWPFLVPYLARVAAEPDAEPARRETVDVVFQSFNRYLGVAVGEHLGYALTGAWSILTGVALIETDAAPGWLGVIGVVIGPLFLISSAEFLGPLRAFGMEACGSADAGRLRRLVAVACGHRGGVPGLVAAEPPRTARSLPLGALGRVRVRP